MNSEANAYEKRDINGRAVAIVSWSFAVLLILIGIFLWWIYGDCIHEWLEKSSQFSIERFPEPRLETGGDGHAR